MIALQRDCTEAWGSFIIEEYFSRVSEFSWQNVQGQCKFSDDKTVHFVLRKSARDE